MTQKQEFTIEDVRKIAQLSNLSLTEAELEKYAIMFTQTLDHINVLEELNTENVTETYQVNNLTNIFYDKENTTTLSQTEALANAGDTKDGLFVTTGVFENGNA